MTHRSHFTLGDMAATVPLAAYAFIGIGGDILKHDVVGPYLSLALLTAFVVAVGAVGFGAMLVTLGDLVAWRQSSEQHRWRLRILAVAAGCLLFWLEALGWVRWISV